MARRTVVELEDDLDGSPADETVSFALDGDRYEIDLNEDHANELREALEPFIDAGRRLSRGGSVPRQRRSSTRGEADPQAVRAWAASNGIQVSARGRISADVVRQFHEAGN